MINCTDLNNSKEVLEEPWEYIGCLLGPQMQSLQIAVCLTIINGILLVTGLVGNILICIVIIKHPLLNTPTDYFLLSLALSDLTLLIFGLPYDVSLYWHMYPSVIGTLFCKARALIAEMASYVSVLTIVCFSTERYLAICHPLQQFSISNLQRSIKIMVVIWIVSFFCAIPFALQNGINYIHYPLHSNNRIPESAMCAMISQPQGIPLTEVSSLIFFFIPLLLIIYQYTKMGLVIYHIAEEGRNMNGVGQVHGKNSKIQLQNKNIIKMLALVVFGFFACWCPFHLQRIASVHLKNFRFFYEMNHWIFYISGFFYYFSSTLNPILYNVMSDRMRNAARDVICGSKVRKKNF